MQHCVDVFSPLTISGITQMPRSIVLVCLLAAFVGSTLAFGSKLIHSAGRQTPLPITTTAATQDGWVKSNVPCDRYLGQAWNKKSPYPTSDTPITLYFAGNGQISGFGTDVFGIVETQWVTANFYKSISSVQYRIQAGTRDSSNASLCAPGPQFSEPIGDRVIINPGLIGYQIPSSDSDAKAGNWTKGACIDGMGTHWEYDLVSAPVQVRNGES
jgi:WAS/WASL-interacting protein